MKQTDFVGDDLSVRLLDAVDRHGLILVHDQALPSLTQVAVGEPVSGSWWSHPLANQIYNALGAIERDVLRVKLVRKKDTLIARHLWSEVYAVASSGSPWQLRELSSAGRELLDEIDGSVDPVVVASAQRTTARALALRLLVHVDEVHTAAGHHVKAYRSWDSWSRESEVGTVALDDAIATIESVVAAWPNTGARRLLPW